MKICKNCKFFENYNCGRFYGDKVDPVTGELKRKKFALTTSCQQERETRIILKTNCGPDGKYFAAKA